MKPVFRLPIVAACTAALVLVGGCGDGGNDQQAATAEGSPAASMGKKVTLQMTNVFPSSRVFHPIRA